MLFQANKLSYNDTIKLLKVKQVVNKNYKVHKNLYIEFTIKMQKSHNNQGVKL